MNKDLPASIPYFTLQRQIHRLRKEFDAAFSEVIDSGQFILSPKVADFEKRFAHYMGVKYAVGVGSGTDALIIAFRALGVGKGDEVIVPSYTYSATAYGPMHHGAKPVFIDIEPHTFTLDPNKIEKLITPKTKAILPVHLYGHAANMTKVMRIAKKHKLKVVEDVAQAHGATWKGKKAGSFGDFGCFSFYPTKNLGAFGDGGMLTTNNQKLYEEALRLRNLGHIHFRDDHETIGWTSRLDALQAACLNIKLDHLDEFNENRKKVADRYKNNLKKTPLIISEPVSGCKHVYHLFIVRVPNQQRDQLQQFLADHGITSLVHYKTPFHRQPAYYRFHKTKWPLPITQQVSQEVLALPMFPELKPQEIDSICRIINRFYHE